MITLSKDLELKLAQVYITLKEASGEHKVGCHCSTCDWVDDYEHEHKLDDESLYESVLASREYFDDDTPVNPILRMDDDYAMDLQNDR